MTARPPLADTVRLPTACALDCTAMPSSPATVSRAMMEKVPSGGSSQATADGDKSANKSARTSLSFMARKPGLDTEQRDIAYRPWDQTTIGGSAVSCTGVGRVKTFRRAGFREDPEDCSVFGL